MRSSLLALAVLVLPLHEAVPAPQTGPKFEAAMMLRFHMHENFGIVRGIERLLLRGRFEEVKPFALAIGESPDEPALAVFAKHTAIVRTRALELATATSLPQAIRREARLLEACAGCHVAAGIVPDLAPPSAMPPDRDSVDARMARHLWAADRLWDGVVASDDAAWKAGIDLLASGTPTWTAPNKRQRGFATRLQRMADSQRQMKSTATSSRANVYAELMITCAGCHTSKP